MSVSADFPGAGILHAALSQAIRAPSSYSSQPWCWQVGYSHLHLHADPELQLPSVDPDEPHRMVSYGAALYSCVIALAAAG